MSKKQIDVQGLIDRLNQIDKYAKENETIKDCSIEDGCVVALHYQYFEDENFSPEDYWESIDAVEIAKIMKDDYVSVQDDDSLLDLDEDDDSPEVEFEEDFR